MPTRAEIKAIQHGMIDDVCRERDELRAALAAEREAREKAERERDTAYRNAGEALGTHPDYYSAGCVYALATWAKQLRQERDEAQRQLDATRKQLIGANLQLTKSVEDVQGYEVALTLAQRQLAEMKDAMRDAECSAQMARLDVEKLEVQLAERDEQIASYDRALMECAIATGEEVGDVDDWRALCDKEVVTVACVRGLRAACDAYAMEAASRDAHACHEAYMAGRKEAQDEWREIVAAAVECEVNQYESTPRLEEAVRWARARGVLP